MMRKPRDYDAELAALDEKARHLKARKVSQLGELVIATGADALTPDELAGALVVLAETKDPARREAWAKRGAAFFAGRSRQRNATETGSATDNGAGKGKAEGGGDAARSAATPAPDASRALPFGGPSQPASGNPREA